MTPFYFTYENVAKNCPFDQNICIDGPLISMHKIKLNNGGRVQF